MNNKVFLFLLFWAGVQVFAHAQICTSDDNAKLLIRDYCITDKKKSSVTNLFSRHSDILSLPGDTIYMLYTYDSEDDTYAGSMWNSNQRVDYELYQKLDFLPHDKFTDHVRQVVSEWDVKAIKKEEKENSSFIYNNIITATRIILQNSTKPQIDIIVFKDFYRSSFSNP